MENLIPSTSSSFMDYFGETGELLDYSESMELLNMQDFGPSLSDLFLQSPIINPPHHHNHTSNITANSSEYSNDAEVVKQEVVDGRSVEHNNTKNQRLKSKKTISKKREREARFAFMTKSEVDHLEDGFRWRKYGQKPVKNSHFPRSYYKCTTASCNVKKRVERSLQDPSMVVTTYDGQHTHQSPIIARPSLAAVVPPCSGGAAPYTQILFSAHHIPFCSNPFAFQDVLSWSDLILLEKDNLSKNCFCFSFIN